MNLSLLWAGWPQHVPKLPKMHKTNSIMGQKCSQSCPKWRTGGPRYLHKALKWSPEGHLGHPWGGLGASWGHLRPDICFLTGFRSLFEPFLDPKMSQKQIKWCPKPRWKTTLKSIIIFMKSWWNWCAECVISMVNTSVCSRLPFSLKVDKKLVF